MDENPKKMVIARCLSPFLAGHQFQGRAVEKWDRHQSSFSLCLQYET